MRSNNRTLLLNSEPANGYNPYLYTRKKESSYGIKSSRSTFKKVDGTGAS